MERKAAYGLGLLYQDTMFWDLPLALLELEEVSRYGIGGSDHWARKLELHLENKCGG